MTLGGGITMTKGGLSLSSSGLKKPHCSHQSYLQDSGVRSGVRVSAGRALHALWPRTRDLDQGLSAGVPEIYGGEGSSFLGLCAEGLCGCRAAPTSRGARVSARLRLPLLSPVTKGDQGAAGWMLRLHAEASAEQSRAGSCHRD